MRSGDGNLGSILCPTREQVGASRALGRYIEPEALWTFVMEFMAEKFPGTAIESVAGHECPASAPMGQIGRVEEGRISGSS